jgi:hypothetical protein
MIRSGAIMTISAAILPERDSSNSRYPTIRLTAVLDEDDFEIQLEDPDRTLRINKTLMLKFLRAANTSEA